MKRGKEMVGAPCQRESVPTNTVPSHAANHPPRCLSSFNTCESLGTLLEMPTLRPGSRATESDSVF